MLEDLQDSSDRLALAERSLQLQKSYFLRCEREQMPADPNIILVFPAGTEVFMEQIRFEREIKRIVDDRIGKLRDKTSRLVNWMTRPANSHRVGGVLIHPQSDGNHRFDFSSLFGSWDIKPVILQAEAVHLLNLLNGRDSERHVGDFFRLSYTSACRPELFGSLMDAPDVHSLRKKMPLDFKFERDYFEHPQAVKVA